MLGEKKPYEVTTDAPSNTVPNKSASEEQSKKLAGIFSIPVNVKEYPLKSPIAVPEDTVPAVTSHPL